MRGGKKPPSFYKWQSRKVAQTGDEGKSWKWHMNRTQQQRDEFTSPGQMQEAEMQMMQGGSGITFSQEEEEVQRGEQDQDQGPDLRSVLNKRR